MTFDSTGGSEVASVKAVENSLIKRPDTPTRDGYRLIGWFTLPSATTDTEWDFDTDKVTGDMTLYAGWSEITDDEEEITEMYLKIGSYKIKVTLESNAATAALVELLKKGDIVYTADDYGGFEKVGSLGQTLPRSDSRITTEAGDVILYNGNQIVLFYGSNTYSYTRLGKMEGYTTAELRTVLAAGKGAVQVTVSLK